MSELSSDGPRLSIKGTFGIFVSAFTLVLRDVSVLLPACAVTATLAFIIQHFIDARFEPGHHFMDSLCYLSEMFCFVENPDLEKHSVVQIVATPVHYVARTTTWLLSHCASVLIDLAACSICLAPLLRLIATRVDTLTSYSSDKSTRQSPKQLAQAWKSHLMSFALILALGLCSLSQAFIPGLAGLSSVPLPFSMIAAMVFSVSPIGFARGHSVSAIAEVAFFHKPLPMLLFTVLAGPLLLFSPFCFLLLPYFVVVATRIYVALIVDPDHQTVAGSVLSDIGRGVKETFGGKKQ